MTPSDNDGGSDEDNDEKGKEEGEDPEAEAQGSRRRRRRRKGHIKNESVRAYLQSPPTSNNHSFIHSANSTEALVYAKLSAGQKS
jgi:hypothetical protein